MPEVSRDYFQKGLSDHKHDNNKWEHDPVVDFKNVMSWNPVEKDYYHFGIALRQSSCIDFYYNFSLVEET